MGINGGNVVDVGPDEADHLLERAAAIDVAKASGKVCVRLPHPRIAGRRETRIWDVVATTNAIMALADELVGLGVERVVLESTSDYWRPFFYLFEAGGLVVWLVCSRDVKNVPGRPKTDKLDALWLCKLNERGMLRPSFVPPVEIRHLRDYTRLRADLVADRCRYVQRIEKLLEDALIKVSTVASDILGKSGRAMLEALIAGERRPAVLADMALGKMRAKRAALVEALTGRFDAHHAELARVLLDQVDALTAKIDQLTARAGELIAVMTAALLHARCGAPTSRLVNGTTATVARAGTDGLTVRLDNDKRAEVLLPAAFVAGARKDGAPNLSHAWARTVDGAQGGTWEACHLLGSSALDAYRGYTGQSRSRRPTHTWNTARVVADHGGALADQRDGATQVADALGRQPDPSMAARSDPWVVDRQLRELMADHERALSARPPDRQDALAAATDEMRSASAWLENMDAVAAHSARQLDQLGRLAGLSRHGRDQRRLLHDRLEADRERAASARERYEEVAGRVGRLRQEQDVYERFETAEGGRRGDLVSLGNQLDRHWAAVVVACVVADDPLAYGIGQLRHARSTLEYDRWAIDAAEGRAQQATKAERDLLERLAALAEDPPGHLVQRIGPAPGTPAGRAVWCHHAHDIEADLDRNDGAIPPWTGWSPQTDLARRQIAIADCVLQASNDRPGPTEWAELAQQAGAVFDQVLRAERDRAARPRAPGQWQRTHPTPWTRPGAEALGPGVSL